jgi:hypothetical protein
MPPHSVLLAWKLDWEFALQRAHDGHEEQEEAVEQDER